MKLIEKLEKERQRLNKQANDNVSGVGSKESHQYMVGLVGGLTNAIKIVEKHMCNVGCNNNISDKKMLLVYDTLMLRWHECCKLSHEHRIDRNYTIAVKWEAKAEAYKESAKILAKAISE